MLKPNRDELRDATGEADPVAGARALIVLGAEWVVVSLGAEGMLAVCAGDPVTVLHARLPEPLAGNATGAGDAAVAAAAAALADGETDPERVLRARRPRGRPPPCSCRSPARSRRRIPSSADATCIVEAVR